MPDKYRGEVANSPNTGRGTRRSSAKTATEIRPSAIFRIEILRDLSSRANRFPFPKRRASLRARARAALPRPPMPGTNVRRSLRTRSRCSYSRRRAAANHHAFFLRLLEDALPVNDEKKSDAAH